MAKKVAKKVASKKTTSKESMELESILQPTVVVAQMDDGKLKSGLFQSAAEANAFLKIKKIDRAFIITGDNLELTVIEA